MTASFPRPAPLPNSIEAPFWLALRDGRLELQRCAECGVYRHPPRPVCAVCGSAAMEWCPSAAAGEVWSYTLVHAPTLPAFADVVPYLAIVVRLDEGVFMVTRLVGDDVVADDSLIGRRITIVPTAFDEGVALPLARLLE